MSIDKSQKTKNENCLISEIEAASMLSVSRALMRRWRVNGKGPRFYRLGSKAIRYSLKDINDWVANQSATSTCEYE